LETSEERIKLLIKGFTQKQIETLYIEGNNFKIVSFPKLIELVEIGYHNKKKFINCDVAVEYAQSLCDAIVNVNNCDKSHITVNRISI
jgi:hypothetical protein